MVEGTTQSNAENKEAPKVKPKKTFWKGFLSFLMMGGWLLIVILILAIVIAVSIMTGGSAKPATP